MIETGAGAAGLAMADAGCRPTQPPEMTRVPIVVPINHQTEMARVPAEPPE